MKISFLEELMFLENLSLVNFRNYVNTKTSFNPKKNLIFGLNAQGKTNLLESIYLLCLGRSFRLASNQELIKNGTPFFIIEGKLSLDNRIKKQIVIQYVKEGKKEISIDRKKLKSHSEIFGKFPIVVMSPEDYKITAGSPSERRRFLDILLSQISIKHLSNLQEYAKILKQRNKILQNIRDGHHINKLSIEPWTKRLVDIGSRIIKEREEFINNFSIKLKQIYRNYTNSKDDLEISIRSTVKPSYGKTYEENFQLALKAVKNKEEVFGVTLIGPHRDDLIYKINGLDIRRFGSRGEHKSVIISTKLAEFSILKQKKEETPIFLLDDYYSELDDFREEKVFCSLQNLGQIFLTTPKEKVFNTPFHSFNNEKEVSRFFVKEGQIEKCKQ